ncbi:Ada metal-binding domain-containing protein [Bradyrhizobium sp. WSM1253]|uniref:Ada metal-binding domain-containing protein n=1 Tax=Bradyrhizobium sp. WSM1253 TaxID=319003 RepID=UPI0005682710
MSKMYRLLGADRQVHLSSIQGSFGGNGRMKIYGRLDCASAMRAVAAGSTYQKHRVFFADEATAIAAGYRPCGKCMKEKYDLWRGKHPKGDPSRSGAE